MPNTKKINLVILAIQNLLFDNFSFENLDGKLKKIAPEVEFSRKYLINTLKKLEGMKLIKSYHSRQKGATKYERLEEIKKRVIKKNPGATPVIDKDKDLAVLMHVGRAVLEYPGEVFTRMDILNFLRSDEKTVDFNESTVLGYISVQLVNRKIVEKIGTLEEDKRICIYKRGSGIIEVQEFFPEATIPSFEGVPGEREESQDSGQNGVASSDKNEPIQLSDLKISDQEAGRCLVAYITQMQDNLDESIKDREVLIETLKLKQLEIDGFNKFQEMVGIVINTQDSAKEELLVTVENLESELAVSKESAAELNEVREVLVVAFEGPIQEAPLVALAGEAVKKVAQLAEIDASLAEKAEVLKKLEVAEKKAEKLAEEKKGLLEHMAKREEEYRTEIKNLASEFGRPIKQTGNIILKSFSDLVVLSGSNNKQANS